MNLCFPLLCILKTRAVFKYKRKIMGIFLLDVNSYIRQICPGKLKRQSASDADTHTHKKNTHTSTHTSCVYKVDNFVENI